MSNGDAFRQLVTDCQVLAGDVERVAPDQMLARLAAVAEGSTSGCSAPRARLLTQVVLTQFTGRLLAHLGIASQLPVARAFVALSSHNGLPEWRSQFFTLLDTCRMAIATPPLGTVASEPRVDRMLQTIATHYSSRDLRLADVARTAHLSPSHAAHLLRRHTGVGFVAHVRTRRIRCAQQLLNHTVLTVKEIAASSGYESPRHLERDFRRETGVSPAAFRRTAVPDFRH